MLVVRSLESIPVILNDDDEILTQYTESNMTQQVYEVSQLTIKYLMTNSICINDRKLSTLGPF